MLRRASVLAPLCTAVGTVFPVLTCLTCFHDVFFFIFSDDLLEFRPNFQRSFGDEFGNAVRGDVAKLGASYFGILFFMYVMLSRRDSVHSMIFMGTMTVVIVGFSYIG